MKTKLHAGIIVTAFSLFVLPLKAQEDISNLFKAGVEDLNTMVEGYMKPAGQGFAAGLGSNWYNTAATHKLWGFDLTVGAGAAITPSSDRYFSLTGLNKLVSANGETKAPTFAGGGDGVQMNLIQNVQGQDKIISSFTTPDGLSKYVPSASIQLTLGLPLGNDLSVRLVPTMKTEGFEANLWGLGVKHDIKQWIPGIKLLPFDASAFIGYTRFTLDYSFAAEDRITPDKLFESNVPYNEPANTDYSGQGFNIDASSFTANLIVSKKLAFFTPYLGVGFNSTKFDLKFAGNYPVAGDVNTSNGKVDVDILKDPINVSYTNFMPGATVGFRLKMLYAIAFHAQYTVQKYPVASVGFGVNFR